MKRCALTAALFAALTAACSPPAVIPDASQDVPLMNDAADDTTSASPDATSAPDVQTVDAGPYDAGPHPPYVNDFTLDPVRVNAGGESLTNCQSYTLNNPTELWVNAVDANAGPGWHHSNWVFVPEALYPGPDGTWPCSQRNFDEVTAAQNGGVFFAQSTQSTHETQQFPAGAAYRIPPYAKIVGAVHVLNLTSAQLATTMRFTIHDIPQPSVTTVLKPLALDNRGIELTPRVTTTVSADCDLLRPYRQRTGHELDFKVFYVLPHYHTRARSMRVEVVGGPNDGALVFESTTSVGEALGRTLPTPYDLTGATGLRVRCSYQNPGDAQINWGPRAADEMCTLLAYTNAEFQLGGLAANPNNRLTNPDGSRVVYSPCLVLAQ